MRHFQSTLLAALACFSALVPAPAQAQRLHITVGGANFRPYPIAAPNLNNLTPGEGDALTRELTALLQAGVDLARSFELVPPSTYLAPEKESWATPVYSNWSNVGASGLVRGAVQLNGREARVTLKFFDVLSRRELVSRSCTEDVPNAGRCVHKFLDEVVLLLTGEKGVFSSKLAFVKKVGKVKSVFMSDIDGGQVERVTDNEVLNLLPSWDPSGKSILFTSYLSGNTDLYRVALQSKKWEPVSHRPGLNTGAAVSPDGRRIAVTLSFEGNTEIYLMDYNGGNLKRMTDSFGQDVSPTWSPDGQRLAFVSTRSGNPHIYVMEDLDGAKRARRLTFKGNYNQEPDWSPRPDGQIAFTARDETLKYDVFLVNPANSEITRLTQDEGNNESPSHSPDGQHIVFTSTRQTKQRRVWLMDVDGNNQRPVPLAAGEYETPSWGPRLGYP